MILYIWRHPKPMNTEGFCIGQTDVKVDKRKIKRLANKIERFVRIKQLPKIIWLSPLQRSLKVGEILSQRGFHCQVSPELSEINFGEWDGQLWEQIEKEEINDWCNNFANFAPNNGESLQQLFNRVKEWLNARIFEEGGKIESTPILVVGHAGWINAAKIIASSQNIPKIAAEWPRSVNYLQYSQLDF